MNNEITAFHPGEMHGNPVSGVREKGACSSSVGPYQTGLDGWNDAKYRLPDDTRFVTCWNGRTMTKCKYDLTKDKWVDWNGDDVKVYMWANWN